MGGNLPEVRLDSLGTALGLVVHDLRNPAAALGANISYVREVLGEPDMDAAEVDDALTDAHVALHDLMRGLDQLSWLGRWLQGTAPTSTHPEDVRTVLEAAKARIKRTNVLFDLPPEGVQVQGGETLERLVELLVANSCQHSHTSKTVTVSAHVAPESVDFRIHDAGQPISEDLRELAFSLEGQDQVKSRIDGRYSRALGLFSVGLLAKALGVTVTSAGKPGDAVFSVRVKRIKATEADG